VTDYQHNKPFTIPDELIAAFDYLLTTVKDKWLLSEMLTLPSEKYIAEHMKVIDVDAIHAAHEFVSQQIASELHDKLLKMYQKLHTQKTYRFTMEQVGNRYLKNTCLAYLMLLPDPEIHR